MNIGKDKKKCRIKLRYEATTVYIIDFLKRLESSVTQQLLAPKLLPLEPSIQHTPSVTFSYHWNQSLNLLLDAIPYVIVVNH